jgi:nicotinamidase-related amidase
VLVGFTANDCIEATARDSFEKGFNTYVVGDATAMFDFVLPMIKNCIKQKKTMNWFWPT